MAFYNRCNENLYIMGRWLDKAEANARLLLNQLYADQTNYALEDFERVYNLKSSGTPTERRNRILTAMRAKGGLTKAYYEALGNKLGEGNYTVSIAEGTDNIGFIIHTYSKNTSPLGPATVLPGELQDAPFADSCYNVTVTVTGVASAPELEALYARLKPAWCIFNYTYV